MVKIRYSGEFVCPKCGGHTALVCHTDGTHQAHCMICDVYYDVEIENVTNADRIRAMSDEELAEWLWFKVGKCPPFDVCPSQCIPCEAKDCWLDWLKKKAESEG